MRDAHAASMQVAVAVADPSLLNALLEKFVVDLEETLHVCADAGMLFGAYGAPDEVRRLCEVLIPVRAHATQAGVFIYSCACRGCSVERSQTRGQAVHESIVNRPTLQKCWQHARFGQPAHQHRWLNRNAWPSH